MICMQYYGDIGYLQYLADYNHITNINLISFIIIPKKNS